MPSPICPPGSNEEKRFNEFHKVWPIERLERMTLSEYTRAKESNPETYRESLCYYLEERVPAGMGGNTAKKFSIWEIADKASPPRSRNVESDGTYCWEDKLGKDCDAAFEKVRAMIVRTAQAAKAGNLDVIEGVDLSRLLKWKLAFTYQNPDSPSVIGCIKREALELALDVRPDSLPMAALLRSASQLVQAGESMLECGRRIHNAWVAAQPEEKEETAAVEETKESYGTPAGASDAGQGPRGVRKQYPTDNPKAHFWLYAIPKFGADDDYTELVREGVMLNDFQPDESYDKVFKEDANTKEWMAFAFAKAIQPGDVIIAHEGSSGDVRGVGIVTGDYFYDYNAAEHARHLRAVNWIPESGRPKVSGGWAKKRLTSLNAGEEQWGWAGAMRDLMAHAKLPAPLSFISTSWSALGDTNLSQAELSKAWQEGKAKPVLRILCGPPGTGKTYSTAEEVFDICLASKPGKKRTVALNELRQRGNIEFVTFHQNYDYADFVEGYRPCVRDGKMTYEMRDGVLKKLARRAERFPGQPFILIIDEINRGNISKIFGELITLIEADKRLGADNELRVALPFSGESFCLPRNLSIIGTMNTADRSIALLDTALRRRFSFKRMDPDPSHVWDKPVEGVDLQGLLKALNAKLNAKFGQDYQIGHAWFPLRYRKPEEAPDVEEVLAILNDKILPLLDEWYYDEPREKAALLELLTERRVVTMAKLAAFAKTAA